MSTRIWTSSTTDDLGQGDVHKPFGPFLDFFTPTPPFVDSFNKYALFVKWTFQ